MLPFLLSAALFNSPIIAAGGVCSGADPAIVGASLKSATPNGDLTHYVVDVTVTNRGGAGQPSNLLQSVDVYQDATKVDQKGVLPLKPGQTAVVEYRFDRSNQAAHRSTRLRFQLHVISPSGFDCNAGDDSARLAV